MLIFLQINLSIPLMQLNSMHILRYFETLDAFSALIVYLFMII